MRRTRSRRRRHQATAELNITAFMNLMVVLVPFLLITAVFSRVTILELNLPLTESEAQANQKPQLEIEVVIRENQVIVADYLPEGLTFVQASASQGEVVYDRGLVWAELGSMAAGESATVTVMAKVGADIEPGTTILNKVAAYHSENAAVQNEAAITVVQRRRTTDVLPVTGVSPALPMAGVLLTGLLFGVRRLRRGLT